MPSITNNNRRKDILSKSRDLAPLGMALEWRTRIKRSFDTPTHLHINNFSFWASGTVTTTRRTYGMPDSSVVNIAEFPDGTRTIAIASTSNLDVGVTGTGARTITMRGLDSNFEPILESNIVLNGQTPVSPTKDFFRINRIFVDNVGSNNTNVGDIFFGDTDDTFIAGIPQTRVYNGVQIGSNTSTFGHYSVGAHLVLHFTKGNNYTNATPAKPVLLEERFIGPNFVGGRTEYTVGELWITGPISYNFDAAAPYDPRSDHFWIVSTTTGSASCTTYYESVEQKLEFDVNIPR